MEEESARHPAVAGQFYPANAEELRRQILECYRHPLGPGQGPGTASGPLQGVAGFVVPHAGYYYSGPVAAHAFRRMGELGFPQVAIILGPNHYGTGKPLALSPWAWWDTPLGSMRVDTAMGESLAARVPGLLPDRAAHWREHSLEVQLPFLYHLYGESLAILPIAMTDQRLEVSRALGEGLASVLAGRSAVVLASSDFSHYLPDQKARKEDSYAIQAIESVNAEGLARVVEERGLTMCGPGPVMTMLVACRALGATEGRLLAYGTSADTTGDTGGVVGYAALEVGEAGLPPPAGTQSQST